jgi:hypothetical protein
VYQKPPYQGFSVHQKDRTNRHMALIVEQGIARDVLHGSVLAWKFMAANGVPDQIIARVLAHPADRRLSDNPGNHGHETPSQPPQSLSD